MFFWTCGFCKVLDNGELIRYMEFQQILMTGCRKMNKNIKNAQNMGGFPICDRKIFFQKSGSVTFVTL